ncbi:MAG TPA: TIGR03087 family PEP-CTERM/XrtA system glycosyltransferase [Gammaproteobacteria bacterium]|nr:TIGR03087 family PEP-CTERM/XrtA system glycosyltransferase [Gammaproteobacteria bacterium]
MSQVDSLLFLCHRIPYPPNKGDKIRSFHILKFLAERHRVLLGTFIDDPADRAHLGTLREYCTDLHVVDIAPRRQRIASLRGLLTGEALSLPYYRDAGLAAWVAEVGRCARPRVAFAYSSPMAQYLLGEDWQGVRRIVDFVDVDSEKWCAYAAMKPWPASAVYGREAARLLAFECAVADAFDACVFVSGEEARLFERLRGGASRKVYAVNNGVDLAYFAAGLGLPNPYPAGAPVLVFTGAMDYWANVDAVQWFVQEILPRIVRAVPTAQCWIVGTRPTPAVRDLARAPHVHVTGAVDDIRPYIAHATVSVAPMRVARGVQNKVLEAMAMGRPVVGTQAAFEGLDLDTHYRALAADDAASFAARCIALLGAPDASLGEMGRRYVAAHHDWNTNMQQLHALMAG